MPFTTATDGVRLHYAESGPRDGEPVLLIQGLGTDRKGWALQRLALARRYRTIVFDNRGVGDSDKPFAPRYDLGQMADDAASVLDAVGVESAHIVGASMGGAISMLLAERHNERIRSLTLACTACRHHEWRRELLEEWANTATERGMAAMAKEAMRWLIGPRSLRRFGPAFGLLGPLAMSAPPHAFAAQVRAILAADDSLRFALAEVDQPTLVMVGNQDILTPVGDAEEIAELIPHSELVIVSGAAHGFMFEHASTFNHKLLEFLDAAVAARATRGAAAG